MFYGSINSNERIQFSKMKMKQGAIRCRIYQKPKPRSKKNKSKKPKNRSKWELCVGGGKAGVQKLLSSIVLNVKGYQE